MPKGFFTQTACVLLQRPVPLDRLEGALAAFKIRGRHEPQESWAFGGPSVTLAYRPKVNGYVAVDIVDRPWPDDMGDPQRDPLVFGAWGAGQFGPFTFPGGLERAAQQCWRWEAGKAVAKRHKGFVRIRSSYAFGADADAPLWPEDYEPLAELRFVTNVARALLDLPEALCYFNPNGEVLADRAGVDEALEYGRSAKVPPLDLWENVRLFNVEAGWAVMDTVGNGQFDLPDIEGCFSTDYDPDEVARFLRSVTWYLMQNGEVINDGDTMDGPGEVVWRARSYKNGVLDPPRRVLAWVPQDGTKPPKGFTKR